MGLVNSIVEWAVAFCTGFFGNVVAHDFCEAAPMLSKRLLNIAIAILPRELKDRYLEEWHADLRDRVGSLAKLNWAFGCLICARRINREANFNRIRRTTLQIVLTKGETISVDLPTLALCISSLQALRFIQGCLNLLPSPHLWRLIGRPVGATVMWFGTTVPAYRWRRFGFPNSDKAWRLVRDLSENGMHWKCTKYVDGVAVDERSWDLPM
jgi:hypothetical protein